MWQPGRTLEEIERETIEKAFRFYQGNKTQTAASLGIAIRTLDNKLDKYAGKTPELEPVVNVKAKKNKKSDLEEMLA